MNKEKEEKKYYVDDVGVSLAPFDTMLYTEPRFLS